MIESGTDVFFQDPTSWGRQLRRSRVVEVGLAEFAVDLDDPDVVLVAGDETVVFFADHGEFMQQRVRVIDIEPGSSVARLAVVGDALSAESRKHCRIQTISAEVQARVGDEGSCLVQDVSASGFGLIASGEYAVGSTVVVMIEHEGDLYSGTASVQSCRALASGRTRYGFCAIDDGADLLDGLRTIDERLREARPPKRA